MTAWRFIVPVGIFTLAGALLLTRPGSAAAGLAPGDHTMSLLHDGRPRSYLVHVPPRTDGRALPVVISFHGGGGHAAHQQKWAGLDRVADREGFIVVYPDGTGPLPRRLHTFNGGTCCGYAAKNGIDDVGFTIAALKDLATQIAVDHTRVYATGMSNGGMMSYRLAAEASERIAAIAPVAGAMATRSTPRRPVPVMHVHSVDDGHALYAGGYGPPFPMTQVRVHHTPVDATVASWVAWNGCSRTPRTGPTLTGAPGTQDATHTATRYTFGGGREGSEVVLWKLTGAGHVWPGARRGLEHFLGPSTQVIDASTEMWSFFKRFRRADAPPLTR